MRTHFTGQGTTTTSDLVCVGRIVDGQVAVALERLLKTAGIPAVRDASAVGTELMVPAEFSDLARQMLAKRKKEVEDEEELDDEEEEEDDDLDEDEDEDEDDEEFDDDDEEFEEEFEDDELDDDDDDIFYDDDEDE